MKNLYLIINKSTHTVTFNLLATAAKKRGIRVFPIKVDDFDFSQKIRLTKDDGLYRIHAGQKAALIESFLINEDVSTLYQSHLFCLGKLNGRFGSALIHQKYGLPIIKTVLSISNDRGLLKKYVKALGGFPVIIKANGGSHGVGVMKVDSFESLVSVVDYLSTLNANFSLKKFVQHRETARLIVLGDQVIASLGYKAPKGDFRSNVGHRMMARERNFGPVVNEIAVKSVQTLGYEFGGVDILIDTQGQAFIAEVNLPCDFSYRQAITRVDISGQIVDHLIAKSQR